MFVPRHIASRLPKIYVLIIIVTLALACVKPIKAGVCTGSTGEQMDGRTDGRGRQIDRQGARGCERDIRAPNVVEQGDPAWMREIFSEGDAPFTKMASSHSSTTELRLLPPLCLLVVLQPALTRCFV